MEMGSAVALPMWGGPKFQQVADEVFKRPDHRHDHYRDHYHDNCYGVRDQVDVSFFIYSLEFLGSKHEVRLVLGENV